MAEGSFEVEMAEGDYEDLLRESDARATRTCRNTAMNRGWSRGTKR